MKADAALSKAILDEVLPGSRLKNEANLLDHAVRRRRQYRLQSTQDDIEQRHHHRPDADRHVARPAHILEPTATVRRIVNMTALASVEAAKGSRWTTERRV